MAPTTDDNKAIQHAHCSMGDRRKKCFHQYVVIKLPISWQELPSRIMMILICERQKCLYWLIKWITWSLRLWLSNQLTSHRRGMEKDVHVGSKHPLHISSHKRTKLHISFLSTSLHDKNDVETVSILFYTTVNKQYITTVRSCTIVPNTNQDLQLDQIMVCAAAICPKEFRDKFTEK